MPFFGIYVPSFNERLKYSELPVTALATCFGLNRIPNWPQSLIYVDKSKALTELRLHKNARLREFSSRKQAEDYVRYGPTSRMVMPKYDRYSPRIPNSNHSILNVLKFCNANQCFGEMRMPTGSVHSEHFTFYMPSKRELSAFRQQIEHDNYENVKLCVWKNPRFLISTRERPPIIKSTYGYNAMHICAIHNKVRIAQLILATVLDRNFIKLYAGPRVSDEFCTGLSKNLVEYYLNMPNAIRRDTPLHCAAKFGSADIVELLIAYPQCNKLIRNKHGKLVQDVICRHIKYPRCKDFDKIKLLLGAPYYIPVLRASFNEVPPEVGKPFTPTTRDNFQYANDNGERLKVTLQISALCGPMTFEQAQTLYRRWKISRCLRSTDIWHRTRPPYIFPIKTQLSYSNLSNKYAFMGLPTATSTPKKSLKINDSLLERHIKNTDIEKGLEIIGRQLARKENVEWREYWDFLNLFIDLASPKGIACLSKYFLKKSTCDAFYNDCNECDESTSVENSKFLSLIKNHSGNNFKRKLEPDCIHFIGGRKPAKPDFDVFNAIWRVKISKKRYPLLYAWKTSIESYSILEWQQLLLFKKQTANHSFENRISGKSRNSSIIVSKGPLELAQENPLTAQSSTSHVMIKTLFNLPHIEARDTCSVYQEALTLRPVQWKDTPKIFKGERKLSNPGTFKIPRPHNLLLEKCSIIKATVDSSSLKILNTKTKMYGLFNKIRATLSTRPKSKRKLNRSQFKLVNLRPKNKYKEEIVLRTEILSRLKLLRAQRRRRATEPKQSTQPSSPEEKIPGVVTAPKSASYRTPPNKLNGLFSKYREKQSSSSSDSESMESNNSSPTNVDQGKPILLRRKCLFGSPKLQAHIPTCKQSVESTKFSSPLQNIAVEDTTKRLLQMAEEKLPGLFTKYREPAISSSSESIDNTSDSEDE